MAKSVTTIPATLSRFTAAPINSTKKRRVAAYARVSTDNEEQLTSYEAQVDYYTNYIQGRDDWEFAGVYTDEGITGTNTKKREGFKSMVADALAGKIDLIITKSVSRFARNTVDSLTTIRSLKEHNVECYFEKENIWTFDGKGELLLTIPVNIIITIRLTHKSAAAGIMYCNVNAFKPPGSLLYSVFNIGKPPRIHNDRQKRFRIPRL